MRILIVDDSNDKTASIVSTIQGISNEFLIDSTVDSISAQRKLLNEKYDLLVTDLVLPLREGETKDVNGGKNLISEIERNKKLKSPNYIIGITQFEEYLANFTFTWQVVHFTPSSEAWKDHLRKYVLHISKAKSTSHETQKEIKPTLFVEGNSDEKIIREAIRIYSPELEDKISIRSEKAAGANWVARQVIVWAYSLHKQNGVYVKSIGLVDSDEAGKEAIKEVNRKIDNSSAQSTTFRMFKLTPSYASHLIPLLHKGIMLPTTLEEMFEVKHWLHAEKNGWLEKRQDPESFLEDPKRWNKYQHSIMDHLASLGLSKDEKIYLNKVKLEEKESFTKYILGLNGPEKTDALICFKKLIDEIKEYFEI